jgi:hypothetical protein
MTSNLAEWVVRTVMLVLAGLVTLSILGSIAAMSNQAGVPGLSAERQRPVLAPAPKPQVAEPQQSDTAAALPSEPPPQAQPPQAQPPAGTELVAVPAPPEKERPERWLEAIVYALLAIAGLLALLLVLLWRGVRALGRIADAAPLGQQRN